MSKNYSSLIFFLFILLSSLLRAGGKKGKNSGSQTGQQTAAQTARPATTQSTRPAQAQRRTLAGKASAAKTSVADAVHWRTAREAECAYGEENHRYSHNSERRVAQLDGYLKAGLIDRKEYSQMLERYQRMDREAGLD